MEWWSRLSGVLEVVQLIHLRHSSKASLGSPKFSNGNWGVWLLVGFSWFLSKVGANFRRIHWHQCVLTVSYLNARVKMIQRHTRTAKVETIRNPNPSCSIHSLLMPRCRSSGFMLHFDEDLSRAREHSSTAWAEPWRTPIVSEPLEICSPCMAHRCPKFPWRLVDFSRGIWNSPELQQVNDDRWCTSHRPLDIFTKRTLLVWHFIYVL